MLKVVLIFLLSLNCYADIKSLMPLERLLDPDFLIIDQQQISCSQDQEVIPNAHSDCFKDICGAPPEFKSVRDHVLGISLLNGQKVKLFNLDFDSDDSVKNRLEAKINEYFNLRSISPLSNITEKEVEHLVSEVLTDFESNGIGKNLGVLINGTTLLDVEEQIENFVVEKTDFNNDTLILKFRDEFINTYNDRPEMKSFLIKYELWYNNFGKKSQRMYDPEMFIRTSYPDVNYDQGIRKYFKKISDMQLEIETISPFFGLSSLNISLFLEKLNSGLLSETDLKLALLEGVNIENRKQISGLLNGNYPSVTGHLAQSITSKFNGLDSESRINTVTKHVKDRIAEVKEFYEFDKDNKVHIALQACSSAYSYNNQTLPTDQQIKKFMNLVATAKNNYINSIDSFSGFSDSSKLLIKDKLRGVRFTRPLSREMWTRTLEENLDQFIKNEIEAKNRIDNFTMIKGMVLKSLTEVDDKEELSKYSDLLDNPIISLCEGLQQEPFSDATLTATGIINTSYTSALMDEESAVSFLYHEISHNLEKFLNQGISFSTNEKFENNKQCLSQMHGYLGEGEESVGKYYKEDFADYMTSALLPRNSVSGMCHALRYNRDSEQYDVFDFKNQIEEDTHSSTLFRVLRHRIDNSGNVPTSCHEALASEGIFSVSETCSF